MEDLRRDGMRTQNNTVVNIEDEYINLVSEYRKKLFRDIIYIIQDNMRGIPETRLEEWIEDYLINDLKKTGLRQFYKVEYYLQEILNHNIKKLDSNDKIDNIFNSYQEDILMIPRELNSSWIEEIVDEFSRELPRKITYYYDAFYGISDYNFERNLDNIMYELKSFLRRQSANFIDEYNDVINSELKKNISVMGNKFREFEENKVNQVNQLNNIANLVKILGFNLYNVNDKYFVRNDITGEFTSMEFDDNLLKAKDGSRFAFMVSDNQYSYMDDKKDIILILSDRKLEMSNMEMNNKLSMIEDFDGFKFYSNNVQLNNNEVYNKFLLVLKEKVPVYYDNLLTNLEFKKVVNSLKASSFNYEINNLGDLGIDKTSDKVRNVENIVNSLVGVDIEKVAKNALEKLEKLENDVIDVEKTNTKEREIENLVQAREALISLGAQPGDREIDAINGEINSKNGSRGR